MYFSVKDNPVPTTVGFIILGYPVNAAIPPSSFELLTVLSPGGLVSLTTVLLCPYVIPLPTGFALEFPPPPRPFIINAGLAKFAAGGFEIG